MNTIPVRPLGCVLERGAGLPALQVVVEITARPGGLRLLLNGASLASWAAPVARGVARCPVGEHVGQDGASVRVETLGSGGLLTALINGRFLFSVELGPDGVLVAACAARGERGRGPTTG